MKIPLKLNKGVMKDFNGILTGEIFILAKHIYISYPAIGILGWKNWWNLVYSTFKFHI